MKPFVDQNACIGCGACEALCPRVFKLNDGGKAEVLPIDNYELLKICVDDAVRGCPVNAISIVE